MPDDLVLGMLSRLFPTRDARGFNVLDYIYAEGSPAHALIYARLFWPSFVKFEEMVFLQGTVEDESDRDRIRKALVEFGGDRTRTEKSFNCHDLQDLFGPHVGDVTLEEGRCLVETLLEMWKANIHRSWPQSRFLFELVESEPGAENVAVMFWSERSGEE